MKKCLLLFVFLGAFAYTMTAQDKEASMKNQSDLFDVKNMMSQLKEQLSFISKNGFLEVMETMIHKMMPQ